jgi:hypothetical protein
MEVIGSDELGEVSSCVCIENGVAFGTSTTLPDEAIAKLDTPCEFC